MRAIITNKFIVLKDPSNDMKNHLQRSLSFTDKSKQYQLKRMRYSNADPSYIKQLKDSVHVDLYRLLPNGDWVFSSGFLDMITPFVSQQDTDDRRIETGSVVSYPWKNTPFGLRDYQEEAVNIMLCNSRGRINLATGLGKTLVALYLIKRYKRRTLVVVPSDSIAKQFISAFEDAFGKNKVALFGSGKKNIADITIGIAASVTRNIDVFKNADLGLVLYDEVHHIAADTFYVISKGLGDTGKVFGLTATDFRSDGKDAMIQAGCGSTLFSRDIVWGVENGWLAKPEFIIKEVETYGKDYLKDKLKAYKEHILNSDIMKKQIFDDIDCYVKQGKCVLCLVAEIEHGEALSKQLGIPFAQGNDKQSQTYVDQLNSGKIPALIGTTGKIGEGTDMKRIDVLIMANFMASKGIVLQSIGRGLRIYPGKDRCIILDYIPVGSSMLTRHAKTRIKIYKDITKDVTILKSKPILRLR